MVTVCDLVGSTALSVQLAPEAYQVVVHPYNRARATAIGSRPHLVWRQSGAQLTTLSLCFQSRPPMDKVEFKGYI